VNCNGGQISCDHRGFAFYGIVRLRLRTGESTELQRRNESNKSIADRNALQDSTCTVCTRIRRNDVDNASIIDRVSNSLFDHRRADC
jgi:hypothetical protein